MYKVFRDAFVAYLNANWTDTPIHKYANDPAAHVTGYQPWISWRTLFVDDEVISIASGPHCINQNITMEISIFVPSNTGDDVAVDLADKLKKLFIGKNIGTSVRVISVDGPDFGYGPENESTGKWYETTIDLYFEHRYFT